MNYAKRDFGITKSVTFDTSTTSPQQPTKWAIPYRAIVPLAMLFDALIIFSTGLICSAIYHIEIIGRSGDISQFAAFSAVVAILFIAIGKGQDHYLLSALLNFKLQTRQVAEKWISIFLFLTAIAFTMKIGSAFSRGATFSFAIFGLVILVSARAVWKYFLFNGLKAHWFIGRDVVLIMEQESTGRSNLAEELVWHGLQPVQYFMLPSGQNDAKRRKEIITQAISAIRGSNVEEIIISANPERWSELSGLFSALRILPISVKFIPVGPVSELFKLSLFKIGETLTVELQSSPRTLSVLIIRRTIDILVAGTAVILFLPLFLMTAIAIKVDSPGPILFRQRRCGFNGRIFKILKFRTMSVLEDGDSVVQAHRNDTRVTRIGKWLRRTSIDELPQLLNVLQGSMSIIGPRPHALAHDNEFDKAVSSYALRHHVKPGITGWAQVNGYRGETRTVEDIKQRVKFDLWYIDNWSFALDAKITLMTVIEVMYGKNAH